MVDYSKWDALELSDDSDVEVHPNVDKRSFIRWKQQDIHAKREEHKRRIEDLSNEKEMNEVLLSRLDSLIKNVSSENSPRNIQDFTKIIEDLREKGKAVDSKKPNGGGPSFDEMLSVLIAQIQDEINKEGHKDIAESFVGKLKEHRKKLQDHQEKCVQELKKETLEAKKRITSDDLKEGFSYSAVNKKSSESKEKYIEVLNPTAKGKSDEELRKGHDKGESSNEPLDITKVDDDAEILLSPSAKQFSEIKNYEESLRFISQHPDIISAEVSDGILYEAFGAQLSGKSEYAKQCVHQALLIQYCQKLGRDGVSLFFQRITNTNHQARKVFLADVEKTYQHIITRCEVIKSERAGQTEDAETIQLQATDPNQKIAFDVPMEPPTLKIGIDPEEAEFLQARWMTFQEFPEELQFAMKEGSLEKVNKYLGNLKVDEGEALVGVFQEYGFLNIHDEIIDATGEGGEQEALRKLKEQEQQQQVDDLSTEE